MSDSLWPCQAPLSVGFSRQEYWSGLSCPFTGDLPNPGIEPTSPVSPALQADSLPLSYQVKPWTKGRGSQEESWTLKRHLKASLSILYNVVIKGKEVYFRKVSLKKINKKELTFWNFGPNFEVSKLPGLSRIPKKFRTSMFKMYLRWYARRMICLSNHNQHIHYALVYCKE